MNSELKENIKTKFKLKCGKDGKFKILMLSDIHACTGYDKRLKKGVDAVITASEPDLVLFNGDFTGGNDGCPEIDELYTVISEITEKLEEKGIPWAHVYGNHDHEAGISNARQQEVYESFPNCISKRGPENIHGTGNYMLPIYSKDGKEIIFNVWALDSHSYIRHLEKECRIGENSVKLINHDLSGTGYEMIYFDQIKWYWDTSVELEKHFGRKIPSFMFFHIPVPEFRLIPMNPTKTHMTGEQNEHVACSEMNSGLFAAALERGDVYGMFSGHEHVNNFMGEYCGIKLGYDAGMGYDTYGKDRLRGGRIFEIDEANPGDFNTYLVSMLDCYEKLGIDYISEEE